MTPINWKNIRALNGGQEKGFEELCTQLARLSAPEGSKFIRKGTPDSGVECYLVLPTEDEWGWQSKYVFSVGKALWSELDGSVRSALKGHPKLVKYFICLPFDLPDSRLHSQESAERKWTNHVAKWTKWAQAEGMSVEFILWNSSYMLNELALPSNRGRVLFWFGSHGCFDNEWFKNQIATTTKAAGPRYTPDLHVEVPIAESFASFGRTEKMVSKITGTAKNLGDLVRRIPRWDDSEEFASHQPACQILKDEANRLLTLLDSFRESPSGSQGFDLLVGQAEQCLRAISPLIDHIRSLRTQILATKEHNAPEDKKHKKGLEVLRERSRDLERLSDEFARALRIYKRVGQLAETQQIVLVGEAGTGKTHLFCDLANQRFAESRPTVILLGQRFTTTDDPARQMISLLELGQISFEEFVGCLEAAAQSAKARCLILIDALNEGTGRQIWPAHLSALISAIRKSSWLAVAVSVRTCFFESIVPAELFSQCECLTHNGFQEVQDAAISTFFSYHGLEFASVPVFSREFSNPLFLLILCRGLKGLGYRRIPRGFHGVSRVFNLYLRSAEKILSERLDYPPTSELANRALHAFAVRIAEKRVTWLPVAEGAEIIDVHLPGRRYSESLYKGLLDEGLIFESKSWDPDGTRPDVVSIAYERWSDHLVANRLIQEYVDIDKPSLAFKPGGPLFLNFSQFSPGIIEALSVQLPEQVGRELLSLAPYALHEWGMADAFIQSVIWRDPAHCTNAMVSLLNAIERKQIHTETDIGEIRITLCTIPDHSLNIQQQDSLLFRLPMPERDATWGIATYEAWERGTALQRLIDWAWGCDSKAVLEDDAVWLPALTLCWCFSSSNRFLRDRATKAAVNLLDGRLSWMESILRHFSGINDLYILERVIAVACGVTLRSRDVNMVTKLAEAIFEIIFASGRPPAHILLRDYARAIVERAVFLGAELTFDPIQTRPPYNSEWPSIPSQGEIDALEGDWHEIGKSKPDTEWAKHQIISSVMGGDFGRYVIGTNSGSTDWLSLRLNEPKWTPPETRIKNLVSGFSDYQQAAFAAFDKASKPDTWLNMQIGLLKWKTTSDDSLNKKAREKQQQRRRHILSCRQLLKDSLDPKTWKCLNRLLKEREKFSSRNPPRFDLKLIQRYVIWRVFDLGWTVELFGFFDRNYIHDASRSASKGERIGKKYQWIAYHEISALIADHYQYLNLDRSLIPVDHYEGPWQDWFRNIDPSHTIRQLPINGMKSNKPLWWQNVKYDNWQTARSGREWAREEVDFPDIANLVRSVDADGVSWLNVAFSYLWEKERLPSEDYNAPDKRRLWLRCHGQIVKQTDVDALISWGTSKDIGRQDFPRDIPQQTHLLLGEFGWSEAASYFEDPYFGNDGWSAAGNSTISILSLAASYLQESTTFDCSMEESFSLTLPCATLIQDWEIHWTGHGADFVDGGGRVVATDPSAFLEGPGCLLLNEKRFCEYLESRGYAIAWLVSAAKECFEPEAGVSGFCSTSARGAFVMKGGDVVGKLKFEHEER